jgi:hypothetical protein
MMDSIEFFHYLILLSFEFIFDYFYLDLRVISTVLGINQAEVKSS